MANSNQSDQNPFNQNTSEQQNNPFNETNGNNQQQQSGDGNGSSMKPWLFGCGGCLVIFIILAVILGACAAGPIKDQIDEFTNKTEEKSTEENSTEEETTEESTTEESTTEENTDEDDNNSSIVDRQTSVGNGISAIGTKITVERAEYVNPPSDGTKPLKDKILKVNYKLENINNSSLIVGDANFGVTADGSRVSKYYGMNDKNDGFSFSLKPGESDTGYVYYDVPEADQYDVQLQLRSSDKRYKMKWEIDKDDVK
ncbi:DUF4352 domain-containing protein [Mammaliicoccus sciuri]|uniref:DUF4352 domain-containing protein n=1 Tax=Mammaliicoccus sciuri TaxID=1296 RepID=UPI002B256836|nr:DUF4352 domain-containing protein [Mammaliicoccus sciuri]WQL92012.1 DUF4352 domain-containing protein [Mammaliicoccus sciuri]